MSAKLIDGKAIAASVRAQVKEKVAAFTARTGIRPGLTVVLVGENPASQVYVRNKGKAASEAAQPKGESRRRSGFRDRFGFVTVFMMGSTKRSLQVDPPVLPRPVGLV